jgi:hypothetical protein
MHLWRLQMHSESPSNTALLVGRRAHHPPPTTHPITLTNKRKRHPRRTVKTVRMFWIHKLEHLPRLRKPTSAHLPLKDLVRPPATGRNMQIPTIQLQSASAVFNGDTPWTRSVQTPIRAWPPLTRHDLARIWERGQIIQTHQEDRQLRAAIVQDY